VPVQVLAIGKKKVGDVVTFAVPAGSASITIVEQIVSAPASAVFTDLGTVPNSAIPLEVTDSSGTTVYDQFNQAADPTQGLLYYASSAAGTGTITFPNTTAGLVRIAQSLPQGSWSFVVSDYLVPSFVSSDTVGGASIVGFDGTIPGPATVSQTLQAGVAVSIADLRAGAANCRPGSLVLDCGLSGALCCGADRTAYIAAHELGHFLGLYHTTDPDGTAFDSLSSTPTCACRSCARDARTCADASPRPASPHAMSAAECEAGASCGGGDNLMFWQLADASVGNLLDEQARVLRANPAVY